MALDGQDIPVVSLHAPRHFLGNFASIVWLDTGGLVASMVLMEAASWPNEAIMCRMLLQELHSAFHDQWHYEKFRACFSQNRVVFSEVPQRLVPKLVLWLWSTVLCDSFGILPVVPSSCAWTAVPV